MTTATTMTSTETLPLILCEEGNNNNNNNCCYTFPLTTQHHHHSKNDTFLKDYTTLKCMQKKQNVVTTTIINNKSAGTTTKLLFVSVIQKKIRDIHLKCSYLQLPDRHHSTAAGKALFEKSINDEVDNNNNNNNIHNHHETQQRCVSSENDDGENVSISSRSLDTVSLHTDDEDSSSSSSSFRCSTNIMQQQQQQQQQSQLCTQKDSSMSGGISKNRNLLPTLSFDVDNNYDFDNNNNKTLDELMNECFFWDPIVVVVEEEVPKLKKDPERKSCSSRCKLPSPPPLRDDDSVSVSVSVVQQQQRKIIKLNPSPNDTTTTSTKVCKDSRRTRKNFMSNNKNNNNNNNEMVEKNDLTTSSSLSLKKNDDDEGCYDYNFSVNFEEFEKNLLFMTGTEGGEEYNHHSPSDPITKSDKDDVEQQQLGESVQTNVLVDRMEDCCDTLKNKFENSMMIPLSNTAQQQQQQQRKVVHWCNESTDSSSSSSSSSSCVIHEKSDIVQQQPYPRVETTIYEYTYTQEAYCRIFIVLLNDDPLIFPSTSTNNQNHNSIELLYCEFDTQQRLKIMDVLKQLPKLRRRNHILQEQIQKEQQQKKKQLIGKQKQNRKKKQQHVRNKMNKNKACCTTSIVDNTNDYNEDKESASSISCDTVEEEEEEDAVATTTAPPVLVVSDESSDDEVRFPYSNSNDYKNKKYDDENNSYDSDDNDDEKNDIKYSSLCILGRELINTLAIQDYFCIGTDESKYVLRDHLLFFALRDGCCTPDTSLSYLCKGQELVTKNPIFKRMIQRTKMAGRSLLPLKSSAEYKVYMESRNNNTMKSKIPPLLKNPPVVVVGDSNATTEMTRTVHQERLVDDNDTTSVNNNMVPKGILQYNHSNSVQYRTTSSSECEDDDSYDSESKVDDPVYDEVSNDPIEKTPLEQQAFIPTTDHSYDKNQIDSLQGRHHHHHQNIFIDNSLTLSVMSLQMNDVDHNSNNKVRISL